MKLINSIKEIASNEKIFFTIGNFDGVHLGHRQFLKFIKEHRKFETTRKIIISNFLQEVFRTISIINENNNYKLSSLKIDMSKQARIDFYKNKQNSSSIEW